MTVRVAINGFGRIGRLVLRAIVETGRNDIDVVAINDLGAVEANAHLLKYDSVHGTLPNDVGVGGEDLIVGARRIRVLNERDPADLPWAELDIDIALECTGLFVGREDAGRHLAAGAKRVLISAPGKGEMKTVVYGVNHDSLSASDLIVSNASCTTNCLAPVADVLNTFCGIVKGFMTTVHAYTGDQRMVDSLHKDPRRARAAACAMIPTSTGAARAVGLVLPELKGRLDGTAVRVPVPNVSMVDLTFVAGRPVTVGEINAAIADAAEGRLEGILAVSEAPLVSVDFNHVAASSTFDATQTQVVGGDFVRVLAWYDNEWGFSNRMSDTAVAMGKLL